MTKKEVVKRIGLYKKTKLYPCPGLKCEDEIYATYKDQLFFMYTEKQGERGIVRFVKIGSDGKAYMFCFCDYSEQESFFSKIIARTELIYPTSIEPVINKIRNQLIWRFYEEKKENKQ